MLFLSGTAILFSTILFSTSIAWGQDAGSSKPAKLGQKPGLPEPPAEPSPLAKALAEDAAKDAAGISPGKSVVDEYYETYIGPDEKAAVAFLDPPEAKSISKKSKLWVDREKKRVYIDGYVAMREGALEMFACPMGSKEHESIVAALAKSSEVHAALLAVGAKSGKPVRFLPDFVPPSGQKIRVWVCWRDKEKKFNVVDARRWVQKNGTNDKHMQADWVFSGSSFWKDPADGREYYRADSGDMICVSNFTTAMMDVNINSSAQADTLAYVPFVDRVPQRETPVRLVLVPFKEDSAKPPSDGKMAAPTEKILQANPDAEKLIAKLLADKKAKAAETP